MNGYVPPDQISGALQALFKASFFAAANFDTLHVNGIHQTRDCAHPFPAEIPGSTDYRIHAAQQVAIPRLLQSRLVALNGVVFAVIGRVVNQSHT